MIFASSSPLPLMLRPRRRAVSAAGMRLASGKRMENVGGTEVISRAREVLFVAGPLFARTVALQLALLATRGRLRGDRLADLCAARTDPLAFYCALMQMADQIDAAADHQHGRNGPENQNWHLSSSSVRRADLDGLHAAFSFGARLVDRARGADDGHRRVRRLLVDDRALLGLDVLHDVKLVGRERRQGYCGKHQCCSYDLQLHLSSSSRARAGQPGHLQTGKSGN